MSSSSSSAAAGSTESPPVVASSSLPSLPSSRSSLPSLSEGEVQEVDNKEETLHLLAEQEKELLASSAALAEEMARLRVAALQRQVLVQQEEVRAARLLHMQLAGSGSGHPSAAAPVPVSSSAFLSTPARVPRPVARDLMDLLQTTQRKGPSLASLAQRASLEELPDAQQPVPALVLRSAVPAAQPSAPSSHDTLKFVRPVAPKKFSGEDEVQNAKVEAWIEELNVWLRLSRIEPAQQLDYAHGFFTGDAITWLGQKTEEVTSVNKVMTWAWLQGQLVQQYGRASGVSAMQAEWLALRMGTKNADGTETGGKSTRTVKSYTAEFIRLMRALMPGHGIQTTDLLVKDRYEQGIKSGYPALYAVMLGRDQVLRFTTLGDAIEAAEVAESDLAIGKLSHRHDSSYGGRGFHRQQAAELANMEGGMDDDTSRSEGAPSRGAAKMYGFVYRPSPNDGRHPLTEPEMKMLYDGKRCYKCYKVHKLGSCQAAVQKVAPRPLN
jgi:hypothetical protein